MWDQRFQKKDGKYLTRKEPARNPDMCLRIYLAQQLQLGTSEGQRGHREDVGG